MQCTSQPNLEGKFVATHRQTMINETTDFTCLFAPTLLAVTHVFDEAQAHVDAYRCM